jgi:tRNA-specific 2-thiouridylase
VRGGPGDIVDGEGRVLGRHGGAVGYTMGKRKGLGLSAGPWYVREVQSGANRVVVGRREALERLALDLERTSWLDGAPPAGEVRVQVRHRHRSARARVETEGERVRVRLDEPVWAPAPGQAAVVYDADDARVLGGGWITGSA